MRAVLLAFLLALPALVLPATALDPPQPVPDVVAGFTIAPLVANDDVGVLSALAWGPGDADGPDLYATVWLGGKVARFHLLWTGAGPVVTGVSDFRTGFDDPLGLAFQGDVLYVADSHPGDENDRTDGRVWRVAADGTRVAIVDGLPNGRHNTNHLRFGPDGRLYITNGNPNDNGIEGGDKDVFPYSGAILSVDAAQVHASPAVLHWEDEQGQAIAEDDIAAHPRNADFAAKVRVLAWGFRNIYGIAWHQGHAYTGMNGADDPSSQDAFYRIAPGTDYGFPFCYNEGPPGGVGAQVQVVPNPRFPGHDCSAAPPADALLGWHVCATGLDFPTEGAWGFPAAFRDSAFVGECGFFFPEAAMLENPTTNTGHKVARVPLDAQGLPLAVEDFVTGLALPTDVKFGPDGAMYVADVAAVYRVASALAALPEALPEAPAPPAPAEAPAPALVLGAPTSFTPPVVVVQPGQQVTWQHVFGRHTLTTTAGPLELALGQPNEPPGGDPDPDTFDVPFEGGTFSHAFGEPGTYLYYCRFHRVLGMVGSVVVQ